ncbi:hypothetical protein CCR75_007412 [Bremia lactucae]|uniref:Uncharacterized protein n=1 Tax=Bremia lactucae TaxID=4779 RepID=A0A976NZJ5_BRELC|nr:hypothetical protein CCR75_007412 [Bremia lactucae]
MSNHVISSTKIDRLFKFALQMFICLPARPALKRPCYSGGTFRDTQAFSTRCHTLRVTGALHDCGPGYDRHDPLVVECLLHVVGSTNVTNLREMLNLEPFLIDGGRLQVYDLPILRYFRH